MVLLLTVLVVIFGDLGFIGQSAKGPNKITQASEDAINECNKRLEEVRTQLYKAQAGQQSGGEDLLKQLVAATQQIDQLILDNKKLRADSAEQQSGGKDLAKQFAEAMQQIDGLTLNNKKLRAENKVLKAASPRPLTSPSPSLPGGDHNGFFVTQDGIVAEVQLASWPFQKNWDHLKESPTKFIIEIGANSRDVVQDEKSAELNAGAYLLTFEPLLDKYAKLMSRYGGVPDERRKLGLQHKHGIIFPLAVGCSGVASFHISNVDGCSSILPMRGKEEFTNDKKFNKWNGVKHKDHKNWLANNCVTQKEERRVPCISLEHIIGIWLGGQNVDWLKVDGQGFDLSIVLSAGKHLNKLKKVTMEVQADTVALLYAGQPNCSSVLHKMLLMGFKTKWVASHCYDGKHYEHNMIFWRD